MVKPALSARVWFRPVLAVGLVVGAAAAIRLGPWSITTSADIAPWWVGAGVLASVGAAFGAARLFGLSRQPQARLDVEDLITTLSGVADQAKSQGVLAVVGTPSVRRNALLRTGLHLLLRDPDQALVRSVLGEHAEREARKAATWRGVQTLAARMLAALGVVGGLAAIVIMTLNAQTPGSLPAVLAVVIGLGAVCLALGLSVTGPAISALRAAAAAQAFEARVHQEAVLAIRDQADAAQTRARLERLTPSAAQQEAAEGQRRRAA